MRVSAEMANVTPVCPCRGYIEEGQTLQVVNGTDGLQKAWWVACPDCGNAIGEAQSYPVQDFTAL